MGVIIYPTLTFSEKNKVNLNELKKKRNKQTWWQNSRGCSTRLDQKNLRVAIIFHCINVCTAEFELKKKLSNIREKYFVAGG